MRRPGFARLAHLDGPIVADPAPASRPDDHGSLRRARVLTWHSRLTCLRGRRGQHRGLPGDAPRPPRPASSGKDSKPPTMRSPCPSSARFEACHGGRADGRLVLRPSAESRFTAATGTGRSCGSRRPLGSRGASARPRCATPRFPTPRRRRAAESRTEPCSLGFPSTAEHSTATACP